MPGCGYRGCGSGGFLEENLEGAGSVRVRHSALGGSGFCGSAAVLAMFLLRRFLAVRISW